jgi:hypothetical protein
MDDIKQLLTLPDNCFVSPDHPAVKDPEHWCLGPVLLTRDSDLVAEVNFDALQKELKEKGFLDDQDEGDYGFYRLNHWAVGWVEHLSFRVLDEKGEPTAIYKFLKEWEKKLDDYPLADEEELSRREYDAAIEWIQCEGIRSCKGGVPTDWMERVFTWLWEHEQGEMENHSGHGATPSEAAIRRALAALEFLEVSVEEEIEAIMAKKFPGCPVDYFAEVTDDHSEDFARVEADLPEGKEFFLIVRGTFADEDAAFAALRDKLVEEFKHEHA